MPGHKISINFSLLSSPSENLSLDKEKQSIVHNCKYLLPKKELEQNLPLFPSHLPAALLHTKATLPREGGRGGRTRKTEQFWQTTAESWLEQ